jgi:hypothetical protein
MSVAVSNCGSLGWITDRTGYRYDGIDPEMNRPWPGMPAAFQELAIAAAKEAGFPNFAPDACLINRYEPGARLSPHQDKNERDFTQPIVSVSLGLPATFLLAVWSEETKRNVSRLSMEMYLCGEAPRGCVITALNRCEIVSIHSWAEFATTSHFGELVRQTQSPIRFLQLSGESIYTCTVVSASTM